MVREIGVHDDDIGAGGEGETVDVGGAEAEFAGAGFEDDVRGAVEFLELLGDCEGAVGGGVVDDDDFVVEGAGAGAVSERIEGGGGGFYCSVKVLLRSQMIMGRLRRSL